MVVVALTVACNRAPTTGVTDRSFIRENEIASIEAATAYDIVAKLRSEFLRSRGPASAARGRVTERPGMTLFVDGIERGPADAGLRLIPAADVHEIRLYRAADAATKYGTRHTGGVIDIATKRERP